VRLPAANEAFRDFYEVRSQQSGAGTTTSDSPEDAIALGMPTGSTAPRSGDRSSGNHRTVPTAVKLIVFARTSTQLSERRSRAVPNN
jgi:hypothetical protein